MGVLGGGAKAPQTALMRGAPARTLLAAMVGVLVTGLILTTPYLTFGVRSPHAHLVLNTLDAAVGALAGYLVYGRYVRQRGLQDLLLVQGLGLLVVAGLGLSRVDELSAGIRPGTLDAWLPLTVRTVGSLLIAAAALVGPRRVVHLRQAALWPAVTSVLGVLVIGGALFAAGPHLPLAIDLADMPTSAQHPIFTGHPLLLMAQAVSAACFALAAVLFTKQADDCENELLLWLGPACALGAFARLNYVLFPSLYTDWLYTGDLLRTGFYVLLLFGAAREIRQYWNAQADLAVLEDRRRLARELHDGVIQELGFIKAQASALPADGEAREQIVSASQRGLEEARAAVMALGAPRDEALSQVLARAARQLAEQYGVEVELELDDSVRVSAEERHALVRIAREAVINAVKHGAARRVRVELRGGPDGRYLTVVDDGSGFDVEALSGHNGSGGYGLTSMRDRARGFAGQLQIESAPGAGSLVRVKW